MIFPLIYHSTEDLTLDMTSIIHVNYLRPSISKSIHSINANRFQMFGIIIDAAPKWRKQQSSHFNHLFQRIQPSVYFIIINDESWRKKMTKGQSIPGTIKELSRNMHQSKSILQVSEDIRALSLKNYLLQDKIKGTS